MHLCGISYQLGQLCSTLDLRGHEEPPDAIRLLREKGVDSYSKLDADDPLPLILQSIASTVREARVDPADIDTVLIVTESFSELFSAPLIRGETDFRAGRNRLFDAIAEVGIRSSEFFCSTYGGSSNFLQAIYLAKALFETGRTRNLLVVCADRHPPGVSRFMDQAVAVTGDGLATCLLTHQPKTGVASFETEHVGITRYRHSDRREHLGRLVLEMYRATKSAAADCYEAVGRQPVDFDWLVLNNYNELTAKVFSQLLGFTLDRTFLRNASRTGHVPACDALINLKDMSTTCNPRAESRVLVYANGPISCGAISFVYRPVTAVDTATSTFNASVQEVTS